MIKKLKDFYSKVKTLRKIFCHFFHCAPIETCALGALILIQSLIPALSILAIGSIINVLSTNQAFPTYGVILWGGTLFFSTLSYPLVSLSRLYLNEKMMSYCNLKLMKKANSIEGIQPFEDPKLHDEMQFLSSEAKRRPLNFVYLLSGLMQDVFSVISTAIILYIIDIRVPIFMILAAIPHAIATFKFEKKAWNQFLFRAPEARKMEWLSSITLNEKTAKEIRLFGFGDYIVDQYTKLTTHFINFLKKDGKKQSLQSLSLSVITAVCNLLILSWIIFEAKQKVFAIGSVVITLQAFSLMHNHLSSFMQSCALFTQSFRFFEKFDSYLEQSFSLDQEHKKQLKLNSFNSIVFDNVSFSYPDGRKVLDKVNLKITNGETIAIVGENGSGKTTLVKLLLRFYDPSSGHIYVDGIDLRDIDIQSWREQISTLFQEFCTYHLSIKENIFLGDLSKKHLSEKIQEAIEKAGFENVVNKLDNGILTPLGKEFGGTSLSVGEMQKLACARTFIRDANLLIFDEPSASLDPKSEYDLFQKIASHSETKTTLFITHRLGSVTMADHIFVLKTGKLIEKGSHSNLMKNNHEYAKLFTMQANKYTMKF